MLPAVQKQQRALRKPKIVRKLSYLRIEAKIEIDGLKFADSGSTEGRDICHLVMEYRTPSVQTSIKNNKTYQQLSRMSARLSNLGLKMANATLSPERNHLVKGGDTSVTISL
jgi:hypothetical protein